MPRAAHTTATGTAKWCSRSPSNHRRASWRRRAEHGPRWGSRPTSRNALSSRTGERAGASRRTRTPADPLHGQDDLDVMEIKFFYRCYEQSGSTEWRKHAFAGRRLDTIERALGEEKFEAAIAATPTKWKQKFAEADKEERSHCAMHNVWRAVLPDVR